MAKKRIAGIDQGWATIIAALIGGVFALIAAWIALGGAGVDATPIPDTSTEIVEVTSDTPIPSETLAIALVVGTLDAQATIDQATANADNTLSARATVYAVGTQNIVDQTATATLWTDTPTPNITASIDAFRTQVAVTTTQEWIDSWTATPTSTNTPTPLEEALNRARNFTGIQNRDWEPFIYDFDDGIEMVLVPVGCFIMGSEDGDRDEQPVYPQCVEEEPFWIDKTEVTQRDFSRLGGEQSESLYFSGNNRPVENITWFEALEYCQSRAGSLPTELQWEYVARGVESWFFPWGNVWNNNYAVWGRGVSRGTADVGSISFGISGASWVGALDMSGNVREWTSSLYRDYPYDILDGRENEDDANRVVRGDSWNYTDISFRRSSNRNWKNPNSTSNTIGFRCARSVD
jgi:formylglycine-generating enzyme required for sulfatase activity